MNIQTFTLIDPAIRSEVALSAEPLVAISEQKKSGIILCKEFHAEFAGPGAIIDSLVEPQYQSIILIGSPELIPIESFDDRRKAYGRRIQWGRWLQRIIKNPDPTLRAERLLAGFEEFFGRQVVVSLTSDVLALLAGVFPSTIDAIRAQHWHPSKSVHAAFLPSSDQLKVTTITLHRSVPDMTEVSPLTTATTSEIQRPYSVLQSA